MASPQRRQEARRRTVAFTDVRSRDRLVGEEKEESDMKKYGPRRGRAQARSTIKFQQGLVDGMTGVYSRTATTGGMSMVQVQQSCSYKMVYLGAVLAYLL